MSELTKERMAQFEKEKEDLFIDLNRQAIHHIEQLEKALLALEPVTPQGKPATGVRGATPAQKAIQGPLPWFKHGVRGFLNKLWYGDHPSNPNWQHMIGVSESVTGMLTLREYIEIEDNVNRAVEEFFSEATSLRSLPDAIKAYFERFKLYLSATIHDHMNQMYEIGKKHAKESGTDAIPKPEKAPESTPIHPSGPKDVGPIDRTAPPEYKPEPPKPEENQEPAEKAEVVPEEEDGPSPKEGEESRTTRMRTPPSHHRGDSILGVQVAQDYNPWTPKYASEEEPESSPNKSSPACEESPEKELLPKDVIHKILRRSGYELKLKKHLSADDLESVLIHLHRQGAELRDNMSVAQAMYDATDGKYEDAGNLVKKYADIRGISTRQAREEIETKSGQQESRHWSMNKVQKMILEQSIAKGNLLPLAEKIAFCEITHAPKGAGLRASS